MQMNQFVFLCHEFFPFINKVFINLEMSNDTIMQKIIDATEKPLEILEQKIKVIEKVQEKLASDGNWKLPSDATGRAKHFQCFALPLGKGQNIFNVLTFPSLPASIYN